MPLFWPVATPKVAALPRWRSDQCAARMLGSPTRPPELRAPAVVPQHLCLATATHDFSNRHTTVLATQLVLVQGDRDDAPDGWSFCMVDGEAPELLPTSYLKVEPAASFTAVALYDFTAADETELSIISGEYVLATPSADDPIGWTMAGWRGRLILKSS